MSRRVDQDFGRYDTDFTSSDAFLCMPRNIRTSAYTFLLALSGWSRRKLTDGRVPAPVALELASRIGARADRMTAALAGVGLLERTESEFICVKYAKWQQTREEVEELRRQARDRKARQRESRGSHASVTRDSTQSPTTEERRVEEEEERQRPSVGFLEEADSRPSGETVTPSDWATLLKGCAMLMGRQLSGKEIQGAERLMVEAPRLSVDAMLKRMDEYREWRASEGKDPARTLDLYLTAVRRQDHFLADNGAVRPRAGFTRIGAHHQGLA